ncbi:MULTISPECIES: AMP-binding protein [unclassified Streptomyces]|uniref:AMP-binding protein n=1 Tax=unclassified Streptomyces TaxID=2593676 RepID=UPI002E78F0B2|nr:AMP-binding protein [Streptomyces sp. JV176]MEE1801134.1 AMP-binding protein [Streptomyces sp. JV176]
MTTTFALTSTLAGMLTDRAAGRPGLRLGTVDDQLRLDEALALAAGRARRLLGSGIAPGERVALVAPASTDYLLTWMACVLAGAPVALVNPTYPAGLLEQMLRRLDPALVIGADGLGDARTSGVADPAGLPGTATGPLDTVSYMHTSGTTGLPKFCVQTNAYFLRLARAISGALELQPAERVLAPLPLFHINPMGYGILGALHAGADALTVERFSARRFWPDVVEQRVTALVLHAPPVEILKRATTAEDAAGHRVRTMFYADGEFLKRFSVPAAVSGYGSTEAAGVTHLKRWTAEGHLPPDAGRHGGPARADIEWRLDGAGLIQVREREPGTLFGGYLTEDGVDPCRDADGWFDTGDFGRLDADGDLVFVERGSESIRVKGEFVPVPFVENHLARVPGLTDFALGKRPGELVDDEVVLYAAADPLPYQEIAEAVAQLPLFMRPVIIARVARIPRDAAAGKVQRRLLAEQEVLRWVELT